MLFILEKNHLVFVWGAPLIPYLWTTSNIWMTDRIFRFSFIHSWYGYSIQQSSIIRKLRQNIYVSERTYLCVGVDIFMRCGGNPRQRMQKKMSVLGLNIWLCSTRPFENLMRFQTSRFIHSCLHFSARSRPLDLAASIVTVAKSRLVKRSTIEFQQAIEKSANSVDKWSQRNWKAKKIVTASPESHQCAHKILGRELRSNLPARFSFYPVTLYIFWFISDTCTVPSDYSYHAAA
jgi:hypothetical protein